LVATRININAHCTCQIIKTIKTIKTIKIIKIIKTKKTKKKYFFFHIKINKLKNKIGRLFPLVLSRPHLMSATAINQLDTNEQRLVRIVEEILLSRMENVNPFPSNSAESNSLAEFLSLARRYAEIIEPSELFRCRMMAFLETMHNQRHQAQQAQQRVQVTRVGAKRVFGTDITREIDQNRNIANSFA